MSDICQPDNQDTPGYARIQDKWRKKPDANAKSRIFYKNEYDLPPIVFLHRCKRYNVRTRTSISTIRRNRRYGRYGCRIVLSKKVSRKGACYTLWINNHRQ